jgi:hypothetical protein
LGLRAVFRRPAESEEAEIAESAERLLDVVVEQGVVVAVDGPRRVRPGVPRQIVWLWFDAIRHVVVCSAVVERAL